MPVLLLDAGTCVSPASAHRQSALDTSSVFCVPCEDCVWSRLETAQRWPNSGASAPPLWCVCVWTDVALGPALVHRPRESPSPPQPDPTLVPPPSELAGSECGAPVADGLGDRAGPPNARCGGSRPGAQLRSHAPAAIVSREGPRARTCAGARESACSGCGRARARTCCLPGLAAWAEVPAGVGARGCRVLRPHSDCHADREDS